MMQKISSLSV
jgi:hypothetical protein